MPKKYTQNVAKGIIVLSIAVLPIATFAHTAPDDQRQTSKNITGLRSHDKQGHKGVVGTVTTIVGTTITLTNKSGTVYTVDATNATFPQKPVPVTLANILVGDELSVVGTVTNNTIVAKKITNMSYFNRTVFGGRVTAIAGNMITIVTMKKTPLTIDASNATFTKNFESANALVITDVKVGDMIMAIGAQSGTTITASKIEVRKAPSFFGKMHKEMKHHNHN